MEIGINIPAVKPMEYKRLREFKILGTAKYRGCIVRAVSYGWYPALVILLPKGHPLYGVPEGTLPHIRSAKGMLTYAGVHASGLFWELRWEHSLETDLRGWELSQELTLPGLVSRKKEWTSLEVIFEGVEIMDEIAERVGDDWMEEDEQQKGKGEGLDGCGASNPDIQEKKR